jgi:outer membrane protein TolC
MSDRFARTIAAALVILAAGGPWAIAQTPDAAVAPDTAAPIERVTFEEAIRRALERNPTVAQSAQAVLRAQALLDQARSVFRPTVTGTAATTVLDEARGFDGNITQPRTQAAFGGVASFPILAATRWAQARQASDQVGIARISAEETRRQVALLAAVSYLAVLLSEHQQDIAARNLETARALEEYARARLDAGQGSRLNHVRSSQERAAAEGLTQAAGLAVRQAQEALGIAIFADGPVDADGEPRIDAVAPAPASDGWLAERPDVRLFTAQVAAADRIVRDTWKSWLPTATAAFSPQYVTPSGFFEPASTWRAFVQLQVPIYDGSLGATRRLRIADRETAQLRLDAVRLEARAEVRFAQESVTRNQQIVASSREAAESAREALRITEIAYKAGATTNIEVVQAQQTARNAEVQAALAEDRLRQARLDLLVAMGRFP